MNDNTFDTFDAQNSKKSESFSHEGFVVRQYRKVLKKTINFLPLFFSFPALFVVFPIIVFSVTLVSLIGFGIVAAFIVLPIFAIFDRAILTSRAEKGKRLEYKHFWMNVISFVVTFFIGCGLLGLWVISGLQEETGFRLEELPFAALYVICLIDVIASFLAKLSLKKSLNNNETSRFSFIFHSIILGLIGSTILGYFVYYIASIKTSFYDLVYNSNEKLLALFVMLMLILYCVFEIIRNVLFARITNKLEGTD